MASGQAKPTRKAKETRAMYGTHKPRTIRKSQTHRVTLLKTDTTKLTPLRFETEVSNAGRIELQVPLASGTRVAVFLIPHADASFADLVLASETSLKFWDNSIDDAEWNNA